MIKLYKQLINELKDYKNPKTKIQRLVKNQNIFPIAKGIYETDKNVDPFYLAGVIYSPSYISFETALSFYDLIPERVFGITNATYKKNKAKEYNTYFGLYTYCDVPAEVFPLAVNYISDGEYMYRIALKEKALLDFLYKVKPIIRSKKEMLEFLFENMRISEIVLDRLDKNILIELQPYYHSSNVNLFMNMYLKGELHD